MLVRRLLLLLWFLLCPPLWAQESPFKTVTLEISLLDQFQRPYLAQPETAWLGVRLASGEAQQSKAVSDYKALASGGIEYTVGENADYLKYGIENGVARPQFVIFNEAGKNPVSYELVMFIKNKDATETVHISPHIWNVGTESQSGEALADHRAPHTQQEWLAIVLFFIAGSIASYVLFGRALFARMLHNRRMEVGGALGWSNLLVVVMGLILTGCTFILVLFPYVIWQKTYWIYLLVMGSYALLTLVVYGVGAALTRP